MRLYFHVLLMVGIISAYLPLIILNQWPTRDAANRYAPMAEALARGDFMHAFHPRCQSLHSTVAGGFVTLIGGGGFLACKLSALLFFLLSTIPLYWIFRKLFGDKTARWSLLLFAGCSCLVPSLVLEGGRDAAKMFVQIFLVCGFFKIYFDRSRISGYICLGAAAGLCVCTRNDLLLPALIFLVLGGLQDRGEHLWIWRSLIAVCIFTLFFVWESFLNFYVSGAVIPGVRFYPIFCEIFHAEPTWRVVICRGLLPGFLIFAAAVYGLDFLLHRKAGRIALTAAGAVLILGLVFLVVKLGIQHPESIANFTSAVFYGIAPPFFLLAAIGIWFRCHAGKWDESETWLLALFLLLELLVIAQVLIADHYLYASPRYLLPTVPLFLAWSFLGAKKLWFFLLNYVRLFRWKWVLKLTLGVLVILSFFCTYRREVNRRSRMKDLMYWQAIQDIADSLSSEKPALSPQPFTMWQYHSDMRPFVYFDCEDRLRTAAFLAGGSAVSNTRIMDFLVTDANMTERSLRKLYPRRRLIKYKSPIRFGDKNLQIWKVEYRPHVVKRKKKKI